MDQLGREWGFLSGLTPSADKNYSGLEWAVYRLSEVSSQIKLFWTGVGCVQSEWGFQSDQNYFGLEWAVYSLCEVSSQIKLFWTGVGCVVWVRFPVRSSYFGLEWAVYSLNEVSSQIKLFWTGVGCVQSKWGFQSDQNYSGLEWAVYSLGEVSSQIKTILDWSGLCTVWVKFPVR